MKINIQRVRTLTTGILHTGIADVCQDIDRIVGSFSVMTHQIPNAMRALKPYLQQHVTDPRFWDEKHDPSHVGKVEVPAMEQADRDEFRVRFHKLPDQLDGKEVIEEGIGTIALVHGCEGEAELIAEAFNVAAETGRTPRQLAEERAKLLTALKAEVADLLDRNRGSTHWIGCEEAHPKCAALTRMQAAIADAEGATP